MLSREIPWIEPADALRAWEDDPVVALLDSAGPAHERARYSYLAVEPFRILRQIGDTVLVDHDAVEGDLLGHLAAALARWPFPSTTSPLPFKGGAVGFIGYELACRIGGIATAPIRWPNDQPQAFFGFYDVVFGFDLAERRAWILSSGFPAEPAERSRRAADRLDAVLQRLEGRSKAAPKSLRLDWRCALEQSAYEARVAAIIEHIRAGDIYQANFTCRYVAERPSGLSAAAFHRCLTGRSPAPFGAFLACGNTHYASVSPERFVRLDADRRIETRPIKGTRPRGGTKAEDLAERQALVESAKDRAENLMIVDLMRNDIGRVAVVGSVAVPSLCAIESFASVHHLVSSVRGQLRPELGPVDLLRATLPGGSITGAPKIRAMQIIQEVEATPRGAYCGIIGWIGFDGAMDSSIAIRTVTLTRDRLEAQAGGGIVADSVPAEEYAEMLVKVTPLLLDTVA